MASGDDTTTALGDPDQSTLNPDPRVHAEGQALCVRVEANAVASHTTFSFPRMMVPGSHGSC